MPKKETLTYHLPPLGNAVSTLHDESAEIYRFLESTGEATRQRGLDHLGLVRVAWSGAHHPRWEYVVAILYLVERCKDSGEVHLGSGYGVEPDRVSSGSELLKSWALLANIGHLHGTFSAERALLLELLRSRTGARRSFTDHFAGTTLEQWANRILSEFRVYQFFQALTFIRFAQLSHAVSLDDSVLRKWWGMFELYALPTRMDDDQLMLLKRVYRNLRRLAYLALDSHYTPAVISLDLGQVASDQSALARLALRDDASQLEDDLSGLDQYMTREFYLGSAVLEAVARHETRLRRAIRDSLRSEGFVRTVEALAQNRLQATVVTEDVSRVVRLPGWAGPVATELLFAPVSVRQRQEAADREPMTTELGVRTVWWQAAYGQDWVLQTHAPVNDPKARAAAFGYAFREACEFHRQLQASAGRFFDEAELQRIVTERYASELLLAAMALVFTAQFRWEWRASRTELTALLTTRRLALRRMNNMVRRKSTTTSRVDELRAIGARLRRRPTDFVAVTGTNLLGYADEARTPAIELDGVIVEMNGDRIVQLTLIESKRQRRGVRRAAETDLESKVARLRPHSAVSVSKVTSIRRGRAAYAWATLSLGNAE